MNFAGQSVVNGLAFRLIRINIFKGSSAYERTFSAMKTVQKNETEVDAISRSRSKLQSLNIPIFDMTVNT